MRPGKSTMRGRGIWSCTPCAFLLLSIVVPREAAAMFQGSGKRETVHRIFKVKITEDVRIWSDSSLLKRDGSLCPASYSLCAKSLGGNCCPDNYACAQDSCYSTAAPTSTCQGQAGHYACPASVNGGCCPQGYLCETGGCAPPAGATYSATCQAGYFLCPSSLSYGCCENGMGCAVSSCYSTSPSTTTITTTTTKDGSALTITTTSVTTPATPTGDSTSTVAGMVPKVYPSTEEKVEASGTASGGGGGGITKGEIGGIIAGVVVLLIVVITAAFFIIKRLRKTEQAVQTVRETTSGTRTRRTADKKSEASQVRVRPTPSEVDQMDYDPLMMANSALGSTREQRRNQQAANGRPRGDSDTASQTPSIWSGPSAGMRWNTPSIGGSDAGDSNVRGYFELPPRTHNRPEDHSQQMPMRTSMDTASHYSYNNNYGYPPKHGRHFSNASELSAGSEENRSQHGLGSPLIPPDAQELGIEGGFRPELPGSDTETESNNGGRPRQPRRRSTGVSITNLVSPVSTTTASRPPLAQANNTTPRRRGNSLISPVEEEAEAAAGTRPRGLGSIDESISTVTGTRSLHGHFGPPVTGPTGGGLMDMDMASLPTAPEFLPPGLLPPGDYSGEARPNQRDESQGQK